MGNRAVKENQRPVCWTPLRDGRVLVIVSGWPNGVAEIWTGNSRVEVPTRKAAQMLLDDLAPVDPQVPQYRSVSGEILS